MPPVTRNRAKHFSMIRDFELADWVTLLNTWSGMASIFSSMHSMRPDTDTRACLIQACVFVALGLFFDIMDGRIARWRQRSSTMGRELDSLSDVISFGAAPACLGFAIGNNGTADAIVLAAFAAAGVSRLARYNVSAAVASPDGKGKMNFFEGAPIPSSLLLVMAIGVMVHLDLVGPNLPGGEYVVPYTTWRLHPFVGTYAVLGSLFVSKTIRFPKW